MAGERLFLVALGGVLNVFTGLLELGAGLLDRVVHCLACSAGPSFFEQPGSATSNTLMATVRRGSSWASSSLFPCEPICRKAAATASVTADIRHRPICIAFSDPIKPKT